MKKGKNSVDGILRLVLWAALLTVLIRFIEQRSGWSVEEGLYRVLHWIMLCITVFFFWWLLMGRRLRNL